MNDIILHGVTKSFGAKRVLENVTCTFPAGGVYGIMGPSGCGKTTLVNILLGLLRQDAGTVSGVNTEALSAVFQEDRLCERASAEANIEIALPRTHNRTAIHSLMEEMGLGGQEKTPVRELSGGMKRRVALLRALAAPSELLLMDEPFTGLDEAVKQAAAACVGRHRNGRTLILITHSESDLALLGGLKALSLPLLTPDIEEE